MLAHRNIILLLQLLTFLGFVHSQPGSGGLHGDAIEAQCLAFFRREQIRIPIALEHVGGPSTGSGNNQVRLARHHIIPVRILINFFNSAVQRNGEHNTVLGGLMNLMGFLSDDALTHYPGSSSLREYIRRDLQDMRHLQTLYVMDSVTENSPPLDVLFSSDYLVRSVYQWMPANIFIGPEPQIRSDDPGDQFEVNSRYIIGEENFQRLDTLRRLMISYVDTGHLNEYNEAIELLSEISRGRHSPYSYSPDQWEYNSWTRKYNIKTTSNNRRKRLVENVVVETVEEDPNCLIPIETVKISIENYNLMIVAKVLERAKKNKGFYDKSSHSSWKDWYADSQWQFGIYGDGISMSGEGWIYKAYGYKFADNSFAVGILGTDAKNGKDNWVNMKHDFTDSAGIRDYAGQVFFDKNGRPVAIVITSNAWGQAGSGWSFIYNNGKWEYESTDSWDERRFAGRTESLDSEAPRFLMD
ncbi:Apoptosis inducing protein [Operophtera brumata]|uniref:Apoptosis inducing protein n=1 Tax=Operophtera brumata TaxID=104452 RepID=A0A0L7L037_OPEBR|nr:Apoptosis inducing protein [Operophtera brumata]